MSQYGELATLSKACSHCRKKKVKCDGSMPCGNCQDRNKQCIYLPRSRRKRKDQNIRSLPSPESRANSATSTRQFRFVEERENGRHREDSSSIIVGNAIMSPVDMFPKPDARRPSTTGPSPETTTVPEPVPSTTSSPTNVVLSHNEAAPEYIPQPHVQSVLTPRMSDVDREEATIDLKNINWQHHGPGSWLSICSEPGIRWVSVKAKSSGFGDVARDLTADWTKHLSFSQCPIQKAGPEPDFDEAWQYATAYFEHCHDSVFGVVYRPQFENHLRRHYHGSGTQDDDAALYAMRNAVYAVGCRAGAAMNAAEDVMEVRRKSLQYFFNALSVYTNLIFMPTGLSAVQALIVMTSYAELLGSPAVEYMLCATAARLAQSKGLHRQPSKAWNLPDDEVLHRNWTFWALYCSDKYLAMRCGRPSIFDDTDISCEIPTSVPVGSTLDISICTAYIRHAQVCSQMMKQLFSPQSLDQSADTLFREVEMFDNKLTEWRLRLPDHLRLDADALLHLTGPHRIKANIIRLHRAYHGSVIALHANFHYPWISSGILKADVNNDSLRDPVMRNSTRVAEAARQILASLKYWVPDIGSPQPVAFYYPMLAIINLFIYILKYPSLATATSDLSFLDIGSGHFGHIHQLTSAQVSFRFPREAVALADKAIKRASAHVQAPTTETTQANSPADTSNAIAEDPFLGMDISPEAWSALSADFFDGFSAAGDMIML
ncbi:fungal-specific transcription factor domain-containing protein [Mariannaea sp. PMI_226]|nr:fungal-specific transcription factor domain-containing protein [Mariannaea sp. PMI_226]